MNSIKNLVNRILYEESPLNKEETQPKEENMVKLEETLTSKETPDVTSNSEINLGTINQIVNNMNITETDARYEEQILKSIRNADQPGPDFLEFSDAVKELRKSNPSMSEEDAVKSTYIVMKSSGVFKERLIETSEIYLGVILNEKKRFEDSILNSSQKHIEAPQKEIQELQNENSEIQNKIAELQKKAENNNRTITKKREEVALAQSKIEVNKKRFENTIQKIQNDMTSLATKIKNIL